MIRMLTIGALALSLAACSAGKSAAPETAADETVRLITTNAPPVTSAGSPKERDDAHGDHERPLEYELLGQKFPQRPKLKY